MPFYKIEDDQLMSGTSVYGPDFTLLEEEHENHIYPVDGWYWFSDIDSAMSGLVTSRRQVCGPLQMRKALRSMGLIDVVKSAIAMADEETQEAWEYAGEFKRGDPMIENMRIILGKTHEEVDDLFTLANTF